MEHEDNAQLDNYLQSAQQNLQLGNNTGNGEGLVGLNVDGAAIGEVVKYDDLTSEHYAEDESEWKYIKEVNQSEKEQAVGKEQAVMHVGNGKSQAEYVADDDEDDYDGNGMPSMQYRHDIVDPTTENGNEEHLNGAAKDDFEAMHTDVGDFSLTSNTASTAEGGFIDMLQVEMKIEPLQQQQQQQHTFDEEDPSSNGTSSLSENVPMPQQLTTTFDYLAENDDMLQNKENSDPKKTPQSPIARPTELNFEIHASHLNPDAKEFVPSFGSNATSPTMSESADAAQVGEPVQQQTNLILQQQHLSAISRHMLMTGEDDVVARSPRKGREMDMDVENLELPDSELDFDKEANKRPHEFEEDADLIGDSINSSAHLSFTEQTEPAKSPLEDSAPEHEFLQSATNHIAHEIEQPTENDVMEQSIYVTENGEIQQDEAIEDVLNSVQTLPIETESHNSSFAEDVYAGTPEEARAMADLLSNQTHAEAEHLSHPPSIEEMHMNLQNANNKEDMLNLDMNSAAHMQESFYMEQQTHEEPVNKHEQIHDEDQFYAEQFANNENLLIDTSIEQQQEQQMLINNDFSGAAKVMDYDEQNIVTNMSSPSPKSTVEEKHLMEETKEQLVAKTIQDGQQFVEELGKKMENFLSSGIDCDLKPVRRLFCYVSVLFVENLSVVLDCS